MTRLNFPGHDPLSIISRAATKLNTIWLKRTYPFAAFGEKVSIHYSCDIDRAISTEIRIDSNVYLAPDVWLNIAEGFADCGPKIIIGTGCQIGRRTTISARNQIILEADVLLAPSVLIMDHNHEFCNPNEPIHAQGVTFGGRITIHRNCWLGHNVAILCAHGELTIGKNSIIGANSVVTRSFPDFSVIAGSPAKLIRKYDPELDQWVKVVDERSSPSIEIKS